jgi:hypothetical protein
MISLLSSLFDLLRGSAGVSVRLAVPFIPVLSTGILVRPVVFKYVVGVATAGDLILQDTVINSWLRNIAL